LARTDYLTSYQEATETKILKSPGFTDAADHRSPKKKKLKKKG
jgi:hypothetical protein